MHFELMYPSRYLKVADLRERDITFTIDAARKIRREEITGQNGKKDKKPIVYFIECRDRAARTGEEEKRWVCNITNARVIAALYNEPEMDNWGGFRITLYPGQHNGKPCIRVRDTMPAQAATKEEVTDANGE